MILDTNALSALLAGDEDLGRVLMPSARHELPAVVLGEYRYGLVRSRHRATLESALARLEREFDLLDVDASTARVYAGARERLRAAGTPIPENDIWIAALALQHGLAVVTRDRDFEQVAGLRRVGW